VRAGVCSPETHDDEFERVELGFKEFEQSVKQLTEDTKAFKQQVKSTRAGVRVHARGVRAALTLPCAQIFWTTKKGLGLRCSSTMKWTRLGSCPPCCPSQLTMSPSRPSGRIR
jgi:hypothetical protein